MSIREKTTPTALKAEQGLLGNILYQPDLIHIASGIVDVDDFCTDAHQHIYTIMLAQGARRRSIDAISISDALERKGIDLINDQMTFLYLDQLLGNVEEPFTLESPQTRLETYAHTIALAAENRRLLSALQCIAPLAYANEENAVEQAEELVMSVRKRRKHNDFIAIGDYMHAYLDRLKSLRLGEELRGVPTGYADLDLITGGLQRGSLYIPAARPGIGKTTLIQNFAYNAALRFRKRVAFFSLEMSMDDLMDRFTAMHTKIDSQNLRNGKLSDDDLDVIVADAMPAFEEFGIYLNHVPGISIDSLKSMARVVVAKNKIDVIMVDYLQLLKAYSDGKRIVPRAEEVAEIARQLKELAGQLNVPIVAPAQVNREIDKRAAFKNEHEELTYKLPMLSDLRESGELEQSADVVMFLARSEEKEERVKLDVAKHRNGPTGDLDLYFVGSETRFYSIDEQIGR